jgi:hypothetical protein
MATRLKVSPGLIQRDLKAIDAELQKQIEPVEAHKIINEAVADLDAVRLIALEALETAEEGNFRNGYLNTVIAATRAKIELLQDAGTLPKAGRRLELTGRDGGALPPAAIVQPVVHLTIDETDETKALKRLYYNNSDPNGRSN